MMRTGIDPEQLTIEHVRNRRERMPVLGMDMGEGPPDPMPAQPRTHVGVVVNVKRIVVVDKLMMERLPEHRPRDRDEKNPNA